MEIILALIAIGLAGYWFWYRHRSETLYKDTSSEPTVGVKEAPYKIETPPEPEPAPAPEPKRCGCGRSASGFCVGLHALSPDQWAEHPDNPRKPTPVAKTAPAKRTAKKAQPAAAAAVKPAAKKPAAKKAAAKKPKV
jgi:cytoskeletal protein RodZ